MRAVNHPCRRLIRTSIEDVELGDLPPGAVRELTETDFFRLLKIGAWDQWGKCSFSKITLKKLPHRVLSKLDTIRSHLLLCFFPNAFGTALPIDWLYVCSAFWISIEDTATTLTEIWRRHHGLGRFPYIGLFLLHGVQIFLFSLGFIGILLIINYLCLFNGRFCFPLLPKNCAVTSHSLPKNFPSRMLSEWEKLHPTRKTESTAVLLTSDKYEILLSLVHIFRIWHEVMVIGGDVTGEISMIVRFLQYHRKKFGAKRMRGCPLFPLNNI